MSSIEIEGLEKVPDERVSNLELIVEELSNNEAITSARMYGSSSFILLENIDVDIALMIKSTEGIVDAESYRQLKDLRTKLCMKLNCDIDLVPHTEDEVFDTSSVLYNPRYYPSLAMGKDIKAKFPIPEKIGVYQDAAAYVLYDNRTITRRQLLRNNNQENWRIFISKLMHGPGNAITYLKLHDHFPFFVNPSDMHSSFKFFGTIYGIDSSKVENQFTEAKALNKTGNFSFEQAVYFLNWYENLVRKVLG